MTPQQKKADELVERFHYDIFNSSLNLSVQCAIICVEEIMKALPAISCKYTIDNEWGPVLNELKSRL
jgi:hypothetical protein